MAGNDKKTKRRKKQKSKKSGIYSFVVTTLAICILVMFVIVVFRIQDVKVQGNEMFSSSEIRKKVLDDAASVNSLYVWGKYKIGRGNIPEGVDEIQISLNTPWELCIKVKEKERIGYIKKGQEYIYFDQDGIVLRKNKEKEEGVLCMEGLDVQKAELFQTMKIKQTNVFEKMVDVYFEFKKYEIQAQKVQCRGP